MDRTKRKSINFDLDTNKLKALGIYPDAYKQLGKSFMKYDFEHRQGSGYISKDKLYNADVLYVIKKVVKENAWLKDCAKKIDVTDIGKTFDSTYILRNNLDKTDAYDILPKCVTNNLVSFLRDNMLRGEVAATQTLNDILDRPFNSTAKVNTAQNKKASDTAAKLNKKSKGKSKA